MGKRIERIEKELEELKRMIHPLVSSNSDVELYDSAKVKQLLNISDSTLYRMRKNKEIPFRIVGKMHYYPKSFFTQEVLEQYQ